MKRMINAGSAAVLATLALGGCGIESRSDAGNLQVAAHQVKASGNPGFPRPDYCDPMQPVEKLAVGRFDPESAGFGSEKERRSAARIKDPADFGMKCAVLARNAQYDKACGIDHRVIDNDDYFYVRADGKDLYFSAWKKTGQDIVNLKISKRGEDAKGVYWLKGVAADGMEYFIYMKPSLDGAKHSLDKDYQIEIFYKGHCEINKPDYDGARKEGTSGQGSTTEGPEPHKAD